MVSVPTGLMMLTTRGNWLVNGGGGEAVTPTNIVANAHSYVGASDVPPIVSNYDILFIQAKQSIVRDLSFNFYAQVFTGTDISTLSSHLFYGFNITEWAWAEEPFKVVWSVRNDGTLLSLTFLKEQELIGWAQHHTVGDFVSIATIGESTEIGQVDSVYVIVQRTVNGQQVQYVERMTQQNFVVPFGTDAPQASMGFHVDAGLRYIGSPTTSFSGAQHLAGCTVSGLADGRVIPPFVMPQNGTFGIDKASSIVVIGLPYIARLQTLPLELHTETVQGKRKVIKGVTVRVNNTLGLSIGKSFSSLVAMKDLVMGNVGSASDVRVIDLVTGDARTVIDPSWDVAGQYCIQAGTLPASILGVVPEYEIGDTGK
jgi:hypothetical protein